MPKRADNPNSSGFNPAMLRWAREWRKTTLDEAARKLGKTADIISDWESINGELEPTVRQARILASLYQRPFLEFFLPAPPEVERPNLVPDFRLYHGAPDPTEDRDFQDIQSWGESLRVNALDLYEEVGEDPPEFPQELLVNIKSDPEECAARARDYSGFRLEEQTGLPRNEWYKLPNIVRGHIEALGVIVAKANGLRHHQARGLCLAEMPLPVIVFTQEYPGAQAFTLAHELGHIMVGESGIIGPYNNQGGQAISSVESWCNRFAAAYLMPAEAVRNLTDWPDQPAPEVSDDTLDAVARAFSVSQHAALVRLVTLDLVQAHFYWEVKRPEFLQTEEDYRPFGRARYYASRYQNSVGDLYTGLVLEARNLGRISSHNAAEFLGIKNLRHLNDISAGFNA